MTDERWPFMREREPVPERHVCEPDEEKLCKVCGDWLGPEPDDWATGAGRAWQ